MRVLSIIVVIVFFCLPLRAQVGINTGDTTVRRMLQTENKDTVAWMWGGVANIGINQGFLHNWPAGGEIGSMTINGIFNGYFTRFYHRNIWNNNIDLNYGLFYAYSNQFVPRKLDDRMEFTSKYGYRMNPKKNYYLTALLNFKSQFTKGFDYNAPKWDSFYTSKFLAPAYITLALGIEYRKGNNLQLFFSPAAARFTLANTYFTTQKPEGAFGVNYGETSRFELGAYFSGRYFVDITPKLSYRTRLDLYANYLAKDITDNMGNVVKKDNPGNVDLLWDNLLAWKPGKLLALTLALTAIYDNDIPYETAYVNNGVVIEKDEPGKDFGWLQLRQILTIGIQYKF